MHTGNDLATNTEQPSDTPAADVGRRPDVCMSWENLLFAHWPVDAQAMRRLVPPELEVDLFDGVAWVGLVPFTMRRCAFRGIPRLPGLADFHECNVRTYVRHAGKAGVWFFSLDAATLLPVLGGRWLWNLNYVWSRFNVQHRDAETDYRLTRMNVPGLGDGQAARLHIAWRAGAAMPPSRPGTLEHFLTERYWLFTKKRTWAGIRVMAGRMHHSMWPLRRAEVLHLDDSLIRAAGLAVSGPPIAFASDRIDVTGDGLIESVTSA